MKISEKIAEIRLQPEHVRMRYVWGSVAISMLIIFAIWIFSINAMFRGQQNSPSKDSGGTTDIAKQLQDLKQQAPSLKDYASQPLTTNSEGVTPTATTPQTSSDFQYPATTSDTEVPQASNYDSLPAANPSQ